MSFDALIRDLQQGAAFDPLQKKTTDTGARLLGRVATHNTARWLLVVHNLLEAQSESTYTLDISRQYFIRDKKLIWSWRIIVSCKAGSADAAFTRMAEIIRSTARSYAPVHTAEDEDIPLFGASAESWSANGRGAQPIGKALVGPALKSMRGR